MPTNVSQKQNWLFIYLFAFTGFFILLEISFFIQASYLYLDAYKAISYKLKIPAPVYPGVAYFLLVQIAIHLTYAILIGYMALLIARVFQLTQLRIEKLGIALWILGIVIILLANQYFYPDSKFAMLMQSFLPPLIAKILLMILLIIFSAAILLALYGFLISRYRNYISLLFIPVFFIAAKHFTAPAPMSAATSSKPNIIIIGVDSARPDFIGFFGGDTKTSHFDDFLNQSAVFSESLSPVARTYPSWVSILTGEHPNKTGARIDLAEHININWSDTLPAILQRNGYETLYATDETRFSNIDQHFGFDQAITPPIGFNDFFLGNFNDFPMSNLLVNTFLGKYLFPYSYSNRGAYITYNPNTFLNLIKPALSAPHSKPVFLAIHFCLSHFPYLWAGRSMDDPPLENYRKALHQADLQVNNLLKQLRESKLLDHSVIVLLSDHGEALELAGDRVTEPDLFISDKNKKFPHFYPQTSTKEPVNQSAGHGTDVLGLTQYHTLLAFKFTGTLQQKVRIISGRVSLLDIKPTILDLLNLQDQSSDGESLLKLITGKVDRIPIQTDFFTETDFTPEAVRSINPETSKVLFQGIDYIQINPVTTRISIRPSMVNLILSSKQYADYYGHWVLALYPQNKQWMQPVLVNLDSGKWTTDLQTAFARQAPTQHMLQALKNFYGHDITNIL